MIALSLMVAAALVSEPRYLIFGTTGPEFLLVEAASRSVERVTLPSGEIDGVAVSSDASQFAYVAPVGDGKRGLWTWKRGEAAHLIESRSGKYSDPAFSPDGWIYFSRSPASGGRHAFGTYAQVFRVRPDGSGPEQNTDENGCHFSVSFTSRGQLQYIHSSCTSRAWVERLKRPSTRPDILVTVAGTVAEATASPDGTSVLFVSDEPDSFVVQEARRKHPPRVLFAFDRLMKRAHIAYGGSPDEIFYQQGGRVWLYSKGIRSVIASFDSRGVQ